MAAAAGFDIADKLCDLLVVEEEGTFAEGGGSMGSTAGSPAMQTDRVVAVPTTCELHDVENGRRRRKLAASVLHSICSQVDPRDLLMVVMARVSRFGVQTGALVELVSILQRLLMRLPAPDPAVGAVRRSRWVRNGSDLCQYCVDCHCQPITEVPVWCRPRLVECRKRGATLLPVHVSIGCVCCQDQYHSRGKLASRLQLQTADMLC